MLIASICATMSDVITWSNLFVLLFIGILSGFYHYYAVQMYVYDDIQFMNRKHTILSIYASFTFYHSLMLHQIKFRIG